MNKAVFGLIKNSFFPVDPHRSSETDFTCPRGHMTLYFLLRIGEQLRSAFVSRHVSTPHRWYLVSTTGEEAQLVVGHVRALGSHFHYFLTFVQPCKQILYILGVGRSSHLHDLKSERFHWPAV